MSYQQPHQVEGPLAVCDCLFKIFTLHTWRPSTPATTRNVVATGTTLSRGQLAVPPGETE